MQVSDTLSELFGRIPPLVREAVEQLLQRLEPDDLDRVVDDSWDSPVTLGVRLVSVAVDALEHVGQAAYVRGLLTAK